MNSQILNVLNHEWNYFKALKRFRYSLLIFSAAPAIFLMIGNYYFSEINLYYPIVIMALGIPRITVNLLAYSIGGEKVYKTFESLLSTPIHTASMFLGKILLPFLFSLVLLIVSTIVSLAAANIMIHIQGGNTDVFLLDTAQLILIIDNLLLCFFMIFVTGILTMLMPKPRQGVMIASVLGFLFTIPSLFVGFITEHKLQWSVSILFVFIFINLFLTLFTLKKIERPQIMARI